MRTQIPQPSSVKNDTFQTVKGTRGETHACRQQERIRTFFFWAADNFSCNYCELVFRRRRARFEKAQGHADFSFTLMAFGSRQSPRPYDACSFNSPSQWRSLLPVFYLTSLVLCPESPLNCHVVLSVTAVQLWKALFKNMILVNCLVLFVNSDSGLFYDKHLLSPVAFCLSFWHFSKYYVHSMPW